MAFAKNWNLVPVTGHFIEIDTDAVEGTITFTPTPLRMIDALALTTVVQSSYEVMLDANGRFRVELPATDDPDITPIDFTYQVVENWPTGRTYYIQVPLAYAQLGVDLSALQEVPENPGLPQNITRAEFDALVGQVEALLDVVEGGDASSSYHDSDLDGGGVLQ